MNSRLWLKKAKSKVDSLDAELILVAALGVEDRSYLAAHAEDEMPARVLKDADMMLRRRASGVPLAYILGRKEFFGRNFAVDKRVLIPRPESEAIIRLALELTPKPSRVLDVGTGSGCLAIILALETGAWVVGVDKSMAALAAAFKNAEKLAKEENLEFYRSNLLDKVEQPQSFDLVVANLPYVDKNWSWLDKKTLKFEPKKALFAKDKGLTIIKKLLEQMKTKHMKCRLILEADLSQHKEIIDYASGKGFEHKKTDGLAMLFERG